MFGMGLGKDFGLRALDECCGKVSTPDSHSLRLPGAKRDRSPRKLLSIPEEANRSFQTFSGPGELASMTSVHHADRNKRGRIWHRDVKLSQ